MTDLAAPPDLARTKAQIYHGQEVSRGEALALVEYAEGLAARAGLAFAVCDALEACSRDGLHEHYAPLFDALEAFTAADEGVMRGRWSPGTGEPMVEVDALPGVDVSVTVEPPS